MVIDKEEILEGLQFYEIDDKDYYEKCIKALEEIKKRNLENNIEKIYNTLYLSQNKEYEKLWEIKEIDTLFGDNITFITNIMILLGYRTHIKNISLLNFSKQQIRIQKKRVKECLTNDIYNKKLDSIRISQMLWGVYFINGRLIEVGRLQYELDDNNIYIHIPGGEKLDYEKVIDSLKQSKEYIKTYFNISQYSYYCNSWLLSPQLNELLNDSSNIIKFQRLFDIKEDKSCIDDIFNFVFGINGITNYELLPEKTSLQKNIKQFLLDGKDIKLGQGKLK